MKKIFIYSLLSIFGSLPALAGNNPFFGKYEQQFALNLGAGINSGFLIPPPSQFVPFSMIHFQYSQPTTFFKLPARQSLNLVQTIGWDAKYDWKWNDYSIPMFLLSEDTVLLSDKKWYFGTGLGVGMQLKQNDRCGSKLLFGFKLLYGYKITDTMSTEIFMQHFSNGNTAEQNHSYAFYGMGLTYNF